MTIERPRNKLGHRIGARGERTRVSILQAAETCLRDQHLGELRVADLALAAGVSPSNFYTYFKTVDEVVLELARNLADTYPRLAMHIEDDWSLPAGLSQATAFVKDMMAFWKAQGPVLRVTTLLAEEGAPGFVRARVDRLRAIHRALERQVARAQSLGRLAPDIVPRVASYEAASIVEAIAAGHELIPRNDASLDQIVATTARILHMITTGQSR